MELSSDYGDLTAHEVGGLLEMWESIDSSIAAMIDLAAAQDPDTAGHYIWRKHFRDALKSTQKIGMALIQAIDAARDPGSTVNLHATAVVPVGFPHVGTWRSEAC